MDAILAGATGVALLAAQGSGSSVAGPLITATATLLGVLVGGVLTGVITSRLEDTRERRLAEAAVRLLHSDLGAVASALDHIIRTDKVWADQVPASPPAWESHREVLAARLPGEAWSAAECACTAVQALDPVLRQASAQMRPGQQLPDKVTKRVQQVIGLVEEACRTLPLDDPEALALPPRGFLRWRDKRSKG